MNASAASKHWMRELAEVRLQVAQLGSSGGSSAALDIAHRALDLADTIRHAAAASHQRCLALEQELAASEDRVETMLDLMPVAVISTDTHGSVLTANAVACGLLARGKPTLKRTPLLHYAEDRDAFSALLRQLPNATDAIAATVKLRPSNRAPLAVALTIVRDVADDSRRHWFLQPLAPPLLPD